MRNSVESGSRLAARVFTTQLAAASIVALAWLAAGREEAFGALLGGLAVAFGTGVFALRYFRRSADPVGFVFARFIGATVLKWVLTIAMLYLAIGQLRLPPLAVLSGVVVVLAVYVWALRFGD